MTRDPLTAMVSYSWDDAVAAELFHEELALRGLTVFHDRCTFPSGSRIARSMADAVERCDAFVAYLTPSSLYLGKAAGEPRPSLDSEFLPIMRRWRRAASRGPGLPRIPVIVPLTHGLGDPRREGPRQVFDATGEDISSMWTPITLDQSTVAVTQLEAAKIAAGVIGAVLDGRGVSETEPIDLVVATRGVGQPPAFLTIDATGLLGGPATRPGDALDWNRVLTALLDVQASLAISTRKRSLKIVAKAHLTACLAVGRVFNQAAGWQLEVAGRHGATTLPTRDDGLNAPIEAYLDLISGPGAMTIEMDLIGGNLTELATYAIQASGEPPRARLQIHRTGSGDLQPEEVGAAAAKAADIIRHHVAELRPRLTRVFCASPADFAVLVGSRLTSLHTDLQFYERDGDRYVRSLLIPTSVA